MFMNLLAATISNILSKFLLCYFKDEKIQYFDVPFILSLARLGAPLPTDAAY